MRKFNKWIVYRYNNKNGSWIYWDEVYYLSDMSAEDVKRSLESHDYGFPVQVRKG